MLHTLLIALALVGGIAAFVALCIFITRRQMRRKSQRLKDSYNVLLKQHNINPDFSQTFEHRIFAFDASRRVFAFVQNDEKLPSGVIELSDVAECQLWKDGVQISRKGTRAAPVEEYINAVGLSFKGKDGIVKNVPVYSEILDGIEEKIALSKAADQWLKKINTALSDLSNNRRLMPAS